MIALRSYLPSWQTALFLTVAAFLIRILTFSLYLAHEERYCQPDSLDYHISAWCITHGFGMHRPDNKRPMFWRTPGYPVYLAPFYKFLGPEWATQFNDYAQAHRGAIYTQIAISSFVPVVCYALGTMLTSIPLIGLITAIATAIHPGFVLASGYLLTDGLAVIFFLLFLLLYLGAFTLWFEPLRQAQDEPALNWIQAAVSMMPLALYTWMRPMGLFIGVAASLLLLAAHASWRQRAVAVCASLGLFLLLLSPWFIRNYLLTHSLFFCPLFGLYFNVFNAPKILARIDHIPLEEAHRRLTYDAGILTGQAWAQLKAAGSSLVPVGEQICFKTAWPLIVNHPWFFIADWITEVTKTTFDLYSYQLVALATNNFKADPIVEFLPEKLALTLWRAEIPTFFRVIAWLELLWTLFLWAGIVVGMWFYVVQPILKRTIQNPRWTALWIKCLFFIGIVVGQTGGFGYARLRLPIEPLISILGLMGWYLLITHHETPLRAMARHLPHSR